MFDNILYERPLIEHEGDRKQLNVYEHILVLGLIRHTQKTNPLDDFQREQTLAYLHQTLSLFHNWSVVAQTLIVRSLTEFPFLKKRERSLLQLHQIAEDWNVGKEDTYPRMKYLFPLNYPSFIEFQTTIIEKYLGMGLVMTACQIYEQLKMYEECVECYYAAKHFDKSKELAETLLKDKPTPKLYCILGDIHRDPEMYTKAWELSGGKYSRAQRSLGKYYYNLKQYDKAAAHLKLAVAANEYHIDSWNLLGFINMTTNKPNEAITCYSKVVQIDSSQSFCWANMANLFLAVNKPAEAMSTIEQAVKLNDNRWKLWVNYAEIAFQNKAFSKFAKALLKIIGLDHCGQIDDAMVKKVVVAMNCAIAAVKDKPEEVRTWELVYRE